MKKKGQAIVEFIASYGLVLLIGFFSLTSLSLYGVLNPQKFLPESCILEPGLDCVDATFYTLDESIGFFSGMGMIGMQVTNNLPKDITHAYVVIDQSNEQCGGFYGVLASPIIWSNWKSGTSRNVRFYSLEYVCGGPAPGQCTLFQYNTCYQDFNVCTQELDLCIDNGINGQPACPGHYDIDTGLNDQGYFCGNIDDNPPYGTCYLLPAFSQVNYLLCDCVDFTKCPAPRTSSNCCDSAFSDGTMSIYGPMKVGLGPGTFCLGYEAGVTTCTQGQRMDDIQYLNLDYYIRYKTVGSSIFHNAAGTLKLKNSGSTANLL